MKELENCPDSWIFIRFLFLEAACVLAVLVASCCSGAVVISWYQLSPSGFIDGVHLRTLIAGFCCVPTFLTSHQVSAAFWACGNLLLTFLKQKEDVFLGTYFFSTKTLRFPSNPLPFLLPSDGLWGSRITSQPLFSPSWCYSGSSTTAAWEGCSFLR